MYRLQGKGRGQEVRLLSIVKKLLWPLVIIIAVTLADQLTKLWVTANLDGQPPLQIAGDYIRLVLVHNFGGAMGTSFFPSYGYLILSLLMLPVLGYYVYRYSSVGAVVYPLASICGGAVGNVIDRLRFGKVVDFIDVDVPDINLFGFSLERWWTFNIADVAISAGLVWLIIYMVFLDSGRRRDTHQEAPSHIHE